MTQNTFFVLKVFAYMKQEKNKISLFSDFPPVTTQDWEEKIRKDLRGADYEKMLLSRTPEGIVIKPYYREEDVKDSNFTDHLSGLLKPEKHANDWSICQEVKYLSDPELLLSDIFRALEGGAQAIHLQLDPDNLPEKELLPDLLQLITSEQAGISFHGMNSQSELISAILDWLKNQDKIDYAGISLGLDPIGDMVLQGVPDLPEDAFKSLVDSFNKIRQISPLIGLIDVNGRYLHDAGSTLTQELAYAMSMGVEYLDRLTNLGISPDEAAGRIHFNLSSGPDYFMEIAKLRAARLLWKRICDSWDIKEHGHRMFIHVTTASWNLTIYDPFVNMLRATTETMSAVLGGADSVTVVPYDRARRKSSEFADRIARNIQILLREEACFNRVIDPPAGAWYIENLTGSLAEKAWVLFQEIESTGGFIETFRTGKIQDEIHKVRKERALKLETRESSLVGANQYPDFFEVILHQIDLLNLEPDPDKNELALRPFRVADKLERIRLSTEQSGKRPKVFMLKFGAPGWMTARAMFAANFFSCAGYEILRDQPAFKDPESGVREALAKNADVVVICSSDDLYPVIAPGIYNALKDHAEVVVAGNPKESIDRLREAGIRHFIHSKSNIVETLAEFNNLLL